MTWSIVLHDPATDAFAVAVATRAFAVGASCPFVRAGIGAVSTQSMTNRYLGPAVLDGLAAGLSPADAISAALTKDEGRGIRQVHAVDRHGRTACWTGDNCVMWCGDVQAANVSVAGNMLTGPEVVAATLEAVRGGDGLDIPARLQAGLEAGEAAGGDRRGRQSAAMVVTTTEDFPDLDIRVDDNADPLAELRRLTALWREQWHARRAWMPTRANLSGQADLDRIEAAWVAQGLDIRFRR